MFEESTLATMTVVISVFNRFFPDKCVDEELNVIIDYMETSVDDNDIKKQNIYSMITDFMFDIDGQKIVLEMIEAIDMMNCPAICEIKWLIDELMLTTNQSNEFIVEEKEDDDGELLREITEIVKLNNPLIVAEQKYKDIMKECVREHFDALIEEGIIDEETFERELDNAITAYYLANPRECVSGITHPAVNLSQHIELLRNAVNSDQRTSEWYEQRHGLITASSAWKVLDTPANFNSFVYGKCMPHMQHSSTNIDSPLHWGQRYEPMAVMIYEHVYNTKIGEFGCIEHPVHKFLGASPDGINIDPKSQLYGRMLEIKNIVNREITGIPKKEYWIQMQLQMEVCNLEDCDFLECVFKEYANEDEFTADHGNAFYKTASNQFKGVIAMFYKGSVPTYEYCPILEANRDTWINEIMSKNRGNLFVKYIYWRLELMSCVYVPRNRAWFTANVGQLRHAWETIQREKVSGFEHRKPIKKVANVNAKAVTIVIDEEDDASTKIIQMLDD
jgi:putative phage-type endonuclease